MVYNTVFIGIPTKFIVVYRQTVAAMQRARSPTSGCTGEQPVVIPSSASAEQ